MTSILTKEHTVPIPIITTIGALPLGFFVTLFLLALFTGVSNAISIYVGTIICTGGISLILWVPLWFGVGTITIMIVYMIRESRASPQQGSTSKKIVTNDQKAIIDYLLLSRSYGMNDDEIFSILMTNGWSGDAITEAFTLANKH